MAGDRMVYCMPSQAAYACSRSFRSGGRVGVCPTCRRRRRNSVDAEELNSREGNRCPTVLTINGGSSSIRFAIFEAGQPPKRLLQGKMERIGGGGASLTVDGGVGSAPIEIKAELEEHGTAIDFLLDWLESQPLFKALNGVGHRVVHGMLHTAPERVTKETVGRTEEHHSVRSGAHAARNRTHRGTAAPLPPMPQVVCFDTAFHRSMPRVATQLPIPRRYAAKGVQRYGFHGCRTPS